MLKAGKRPLAKVVKVKESNENLILETEKGLLRIEPYADRMIRITYTLETAFAASRGPGIVARPSRCHWHWEEADGRIMIKTDSITIALDQQTCALTYYDEKGDIMLQEPVSGGKFLEAFDSYETVLDEDSHVEEIETPDGLKEVVTEGKKVFDRTLYHARLELEWQEGEALYGLGQQEEGRLNLRGSRQYLHQANMKIPMPLMLSTNGYGILFNTYSTMVFNDNDYGSYVYSEAVGEMDFYFIAGDGFDEIISGYRQLSGKAVMLPKWAYGYMQSKERYETQKEILETVSEYRRRKVPLDTVILDWHSWEQGMWGQKTFDKNRFPEPAAMIESLHRLGARFMISIWPNMYKESANHKEMLEQGTLFQKSETYNALDESARKLYWKQVDEGLFTHGVDAWWCDSCEPFVPEWRSPEKPEPDKNMVAFHETARTYMPEDMTNAFPFYHARTIYEGQRKATEERRVVNLTRSGWIGQQRYGCILWSGDISAKWSTLRKQIAAGLNLCAAGHPYWTLDIGGFFTKYGHRWFWDGDYDEGCKDLGYRELYTRWLQFGVFLPVFRSHGTDTPREIWQFGDEGDRFYDTIKSFIQLRYKLLPYIYSLAGMVHHEDSTIMRLLAFDWPEDEKVYDIDDQYMFGSQIMVCPVTEAMYYGSGSRELSGVKETRSVYLPKDTDWYDFWTGQVFEGGSLIEAEATLEKIPVYVRAGSILPMAEVAESTQWSSDSKLDLVIYPGADGSFVIYQDEKDGYGYEEGAFARIRLVWDKSMKELSIGKREGSYDGMPTAMTFKIAPLGMVNKELEYRGEAMTVRW